MSIEFADKTPLDDEDFLRIAQSHFHGDDWGEEDLRSNWEDAYAYYKGQAPAPVDGTNSDVVSADVSDTLEWMLPSIIKPLVESPDVVRFDPINPEDQDQADSESDYVHHTFMKRCNGFLKLYCHIKDALLLKVGVFCTYWDEKVTNVKETYEDLSEAELADLLNPDDGSTVKLIESEGREVPLIDPLTGEQVMQAPPQPQPPAMPQQPPGPAQGQVPPPGVPQGAPMPQQPPPPPQPVTEMRYTVTVRRFTPRGQPVVENCVPEAFKVDMSHDSIDLTDARFCAYTFVETRAGLLATGYDEDLVESVPVGSSRLTSPYDEVRWAREDVERESMLFQDGRAQDPSQDLVDVSRVYLRVDADGDGYDEHWLVILGGANGEVLLDRYEVPENPFSASTPFIAAHKFYGYSLFDKVRQLADHKTKVLRMLEDNLDLANNPRKKVIRGQANLVDLMISQPGGIWRMDQPGAVEEVPTPMMSQNAFAMLDYYDKMRSERTGLDPNAQAISKIMPEESMNHAMERVLSMKEELVGLIIRVFAETGVKDMFLKLRGLMLRNATHQELVQLRNKWVTLNPGNWVERTNSTVVVGLGTGDRIRKMQGLSQVFQLQQQAMQGGLMGVLVSPERIGYTISEMIRVQGLGDPDDYILEPGLLQDPRNANSPRGKEMIRAQQMAEQQQQQAMMQEQAKQQAAQQAQAELLNLQREIEQIRAQTKIQEQTLKNEQDTKDSALQALQAQQDRMAENLQFVEELRLKWAELAATETEAESKLVLDAAKTMVAAQKGNGGNTTE